MTPRCGTQPHLAAWDIIKCSQLDFKGILLGYQSTTVPPASLARQRHKKNVLVISDLFLFFEDESTFFGFPTFMFSSKNKAIRKPLQGLPAHHNKSSWFWFNFNPFIAMGNFKFRRKCSNINLKKNWNWMNCSRQCLTNPELRNFTYLSMTEF